MAELFDFPKPRQDSSTSNVLKHHIEDAKNRHAVREFIEGIEVISRRDHLRAALILQMFLQLMRDVDV